MRANNAKLHTVIANSLFARHAVLVRGNSRGVRIIKTPDGKNHRVTTRVSTLDSIGGSSGSQVRATTASGWISPQPQQALRMSTAVSEGVPKDRTAPPASIGEAVQVTSLLRFVLLHIDDHHDQHHCHHENGDSDNPCEHLKPPPPKAPALTIPKTAGYSSQACADPALALSVRGFTLPNR